MGFLASILGPALPTLAANTHTTLAEIGFLFTARSFGYLVGSLRGGQAYDRLPGNRLLGLMLLGFTVGLALIPFIGSLWVLTGLLFLLGLCEGALDIGANLLLVWARRDNPNPFLNGLHFFFGFGALLSPIFVAQALLRTGGIAAAFWLLALYPVPVALALLRLPSPPPQPTSEAAALPGMPINGWLVGLISLIFALYVSAEVAFGGWVYTYTLARGLGDIASAAYLTSAFWGALMAGRLASIPIATRIPPQKLLLADLLGCLASLGLILLFPTAYWAVWAGAMGLGLAMASFFPSLLAFAGQTLPASGRVTRWFFVGTGAGGMILPWLIGALAERGGPQTTMPAIFADVALGLALFLVCVRATRPALDRPGMQHLPE